MCPPVMPSAGPETCMCGPGMCPSLISSRRATSVKPLAPTLRAQALNFGLFSGADSLDFGIAGSARAVPDPERLLEHLETSLKDLERAVGP